VNTKGGQVQCKSGSWSNKGTINIIGGTQLNSCAIVNSGAVNLRSDSGFPTVLLNLPIDPQSSGSVSAEGSIHLLVAVINNLSVKGQLTVLNNGNVVLAGVKVLSSSNITSGIILQEPSTTQISALSNSGFLNVVGAAAEAHIVGSATIQLLNVNLGRVSFANGGQIMFVQATGGRINFDDTTNVGSFSTDGTQLSGNGPLNSAVSSISGNTQITTTINVGESLAVTSKQLTLDGTIAIGNQASLKVGGVQAFWGPTSPERPGTLVNGGQFVVAFPNITMNSLLYKGQGSIWVLDATADFQNVNISAGAVGLNATRSILKGESFRFGYFSLSGPRKGSSIGILVDADYSTCISPCRSSAPQFPAQTYWAKVSSA